MDILILQNMTILFELKVNFFYQSLYVFFKQSKTLILQLKIFLHYIS